jgi:hypothetical protein
VNTVTEVPPAAFDRETLREIARMAIGRSWNYDPLGCDDHPAAERVTEAVWPLLEHAQDAAAGRHEGIRLWMLDCGQLTQRHRERAAELRRSLDSVAALLPVIRHALEFTEEHGEARADCREALRALDEVWPF